MGQRANLFVVEHDRREMYYSHWCANTITCDLFWGPEHATAFIRMQRAVDESEWLDEIWAEGGAVVDCDNRVFMLYGGEDLIYDVPLRRVYLDMLCRVWQGWDVRWAHEGIADIADYVGYQRSKVLSERNSSATDGQALLSPPEEKNWVDLVGSVQFDPDSLRFFPLAGNVMTYLSVGPRFLSAYNRSSGEDRLMLNEWTKEFPRGGFHIDVDCKMLDFWIAEDAAEAQSRVSKSWDGWTATWHRDHFESQLDLADSRLQFPMRDRSQLEEELIHMLLSLEITFDARKTFDELAAHQDFKGKPMTINPYALRNDRLPVSPDRRRSILSCALARDIGQRDEVISIIPPK